MLKITTGQLNYRSRRRQGEEALFFTVARIMRQFESIFPLFAMANDQNIKKLRNINRSSDSGTDDYVNSNGRVMPKYRFARDAKKKKKPI